MSQYVYGIKDPTTGAMSLLGIMTDFHVVTSGTEQDLPGQTSCDEIADAGVSDIKTTVDFTVRGDAFDAQTIKTIVGSKFTVGISSEEVCTGSNASDRKSMTLSFTIKVTNADITAKQKDWWDTKITGVVVWD